MVAFVKEQLAFHKQSAERFVDKPYRKTRHLETAAKLQELLDLMLERQSAQVRALTATAPLIDQSRRLTLTPSDIADLPEDLLAELSVSTDRVEFQILSLLEESGGVLSLDQILVGLYRATKQIHKRQTITSRLYRMNQKGLVESVPERKGVYRLMPDGQGRMDAE
jgi:hypothetical protein